MREINEDIFPELVELTSRIKSGHSFIRHMLKIAERERERNETHLRSIILELN